MGLLSIFSRKAKPLLPLPRGSFTVDKDGRVLASTLPQAYPANFAEGIGLEVLAAFREAHGAQMAVSEFVIRYSSLKLTARELRGGAIVFLAPLTLSSKPS